MLQILFLPDLNIWIKLALFTLLRLKNKKLNIFTRNITYMC